jgi:acetyltransferase-like isoleucine patch superfamily enzyme
MPIKLGEGLKNALVRAGVEVLWVPESVYVADNCVFEPPCGLKWMKVEHSLYMGAFSYAVSGYFFAVSMGRYCSIGEGVQMGRNDHPTTWLSTSPFQYLRQPLFEVGNGFEHASEYHGYRAPVPPKGNPPTKVKPITIGNDVWVGHGALVRPGTTIGDGAIVGAHAVVTKDVPPYSVVVGNPGKVVKQRFPDGIISDLLDLKWWRLAPWQLRGTPFHDIRGAIAHLRALPHVESYAPEKVSLKTLAAKCGDQLLARHQQ